MNYESVLVLGATGPTGKNVVEQLAKSKMNPKIFALCRNPNNFDEKTKILCYGVIQGNARERKDLKLALDQSNADIVIVAIGNGKSLKKDDIRTASAEALVSVLRQPQYSHVHVLVVSTIGAGDSRIIAGRCMGLFLEYYIRHVLTDHNGQEAAFLNAMKDRTMIVRPTGLTENEATGKVVLFDGKKKCPTMKIDRKDLAEWLVSEAMFGNAGSFGSKPIHITCMN